MPRMYKPEGGYHNFNISEVDAAKADGWKIVTDDEWNKIIQSKSKTDTIEEQPPKAGRRGKQLS